MTEKVEWLSPNAFASQEDVSTRAVLNAIQSGRFTSKALKKTKTKTGKDRYLIHPEYGSKEFVQNRKEKPKNITDDVYQQARRQEQIARAKIADLDAREREGDLVDVEKIKSYHSKIATELVTLIDTEITRIAPSLINQTSTLEIEKLLREKFMRYFEDFSRACEGKGPYSERIR